MAAGDIKIAISSETKAFRQGVESGIIDPLEDAERALDELGRNRGPADLEDDLRDAQRQTERLADETKDTARDIERAYRDAGRSGSRDFDRLGDGAREVQQEIGQNLGEAVSSVRGDLSDLGQVGQDTLGGLAATLASSGPAGIVGAAALAAGAAGLGLVTSELEAQSDWADDLRDRLTSAYSAAAEEGRNYLTEAQIIADVHDLMFNTDRADEWKRLQEDANQLGLDRIEVYRANAGDLEAQESVQQAINTLLDSAASKYTTIKDGIEKTKPEISSMASRWEVVVTENENARAATEEYQEVVKQSKTEQEKVNTEIGKTAEKLRAIADGTYNPMINIGVRGEDEAKRAVDRVVQYAGDRVARITIDGRTME